MYSPVPRPGRGHFQHLEEPSSAPIFTASWKGRSSLGENLHQNKSFWGGSRFFWSIGFDWQSLLWLRCSQNQRRRWPSPVRFNADSSSSFQCQLNSLTVVCTEPSAEEDLPFRGPQALGRGSSSGPSCFGPSVGVAWGGPGPMTIPEPLLLML